MASLTPEAQQLIARNGLGNPTAVYKPNTVGGVIGALFIIAFCTAWTVLALALSNQMSSFAVSDSIAQILRIVFPLFGVVLMLVGFVMLIRTIANRHSRAFVCVNGVGCITGKGANVARWGDIVTVTHSIDVRTTTQRHQNGMTSTSTQVSHKFVAHCQDGRKILFDKTSCGRKVEELGETLQVEVARRNQGRGSRP